MSAAPQPPPLVLPRTPLEAALRFRRDFGWSVVPVNPNTKIPFVKWKVRQTQAATEEEIRAYWRQFPHAGVAVVTGMASQLWVVEVDTPEAQALLDALDLPPTPTVRTRRGHHYYFRRPGPVGTTAREGLDQRGDGGLVVAPPSVRMTESGRHCYTWPPGLSPWEIEPAVPPQALIDLFADQPAASAGARPGAHGPGAGSTRESYASLLANGSPQGQRNSDAARLAGHLLARDLPAEEVTALLAGWAARCTPALSQDELTTVVASVAASHARNHQEADGVGSTERAEGADGTDDEAEGEWVTVRARALEKLPRPALARRCAEAEFRLRAANQWLALITRVAGHQTVITPEDDPTASRSRPILSATDRVDGVNILLKMRAAAGGLIPTGDVPLNRGQIAKARRGSASTVSTSVRQLNKVGLLAVIQGKDHESNRYRLPASMPGMECPITPDLLDLDSARRRKERNRCCRKCGGANFIEERRTRIICRDCETIYEEQTTSHPVKVADAEEGDAETDVANCNAWVMANTGSASHGEAADARSLFGEFGERKRKRILDRVAARHGRGHEDWRPIVDEPDETDVANCNTGPPPKVCHKHPHAALWERASNVGGGWVCSICHPKPPPITRTPPAQGCGAAAMQGAAR